MEEFGELDIGDLLDTSALFPVPSTDVHVGEWGATPLSPMPATIDDSLSKKSSLYFSHLLDATDILPLDIDAGSIQFHDSRSRVDSDEVADLSEIIDTTLRTEVLNDLIDEEIRLV